MELRTISKQIVQNHQTSPIKANCQVKVGFCSAPGATRALETQSNVMKPRKNSARARGNRKISRALRAVVRSGLASGSFQNLIETLE